MTPHPATAPVRMARRGLRTGALATVALATLAVFAVFARGAEAAGFGFVPGSLQVSALDKDGSIDTQAGSHPYGFTVSFAFNTIEVGGKTELAEHVRGIEVDLPRGLIGDPLAVPRCPRVDFEAVVPHCPGDTQVGMLHAVVSAGPAELPVYNLAPPPGVPASLGASAIGLNAILNGSVRTGEGYGLLVAGDNVASESLASVEATIWGVPPAAGHDAERTCWPGGGNTAIVGCASEVAPVAFLTLPTSCSGPLETTVRANSRENPGVFVSQSTLSPGLAGCERLPFVPSISTAPETGAAASPTGLHFDLHIPQNEEPEGLATAELEGAVVTLPAGLTVDTSEANGLAACTPAQVALGSPAPAACPEASKLGSVEVQTPLIAHPLPGAVYLASQQENPFHSLLAIYITVYDPITGVVVKIPGRIETGGEEGAAPGLAPGQLRATVQEDPQLPFEDFKLDFFGGPRAALTTPPTCGSYTTSASLTPWSAPEGATVFPVSPPFHITSGAGGGACPASEAQEPNAPGLEAGTTVPLAGAYSPFVLRLTREDGSQPLQAIDVTLPPGLTGKLAGIAECPASAIAQAESRSHPGEGKLEQQDPSCPAASELGTVTAGVGSGLPFYTQGRAYLAGPYEGAPFSVVITVPAVAGPFDLGTVTVRSALFINPQTAQVTVKSDPIPSILDGIPVDLRSIAVDVSRPEFTLNPTSCASMTLIGQALSTLEQTAALSEHFQVTGCTNLQYKPTIAVSTQAKASKANGTSLTVHIAFPHPGPQSGNQSGEANIARVHVELPKSLPARLTTLQKACTEKQFASNPAGCPAESVVGHAKAITPILPVPLEGPAYLVSHGGAAFPELIMVLQGYGVTIQLNGETFINGKTNVTSSTFAHVPDAPVESFELTLPQGKYSALAAYGNLCQQKLVMPTQFVAQNGATLNQDTHIEVTGCPNTISILSHSVKKHTLKLSVYGPASGKLTASGKGVSSQTKSYSGQEALTFTLRQKKAGKLSTKIKLIFTPKSGKKLSKSLTVKFKQ